MSHGLVGWHVGRAGRGRWGLERLRRLARGVLAATLVSVVSVASAHAQTAQLSGHVVDDTEAVVDGALVVVTNVDTGLSREVRTNTSGQYVVPALANGRYTVTVTAPNFAPVTRAILIDVAQAARLDFRLQVAGVTEAVTVSTEARPLQSTDGALSTVIDRRFISSLPLNGRTLQSLISLVPGVVAVPQGDGNAGQFSVNGQRSDTNSFSVDGVSANLGVSSGGYGEDFAGVQPAASTTGITSSLASLDSVQEFRIQTSSFAPEFGRSPGGQVQLVTRSGANAFTGAASAYFRDEQLDANDWFANREGLPRAKLRHVNPGGVLGGPITKDRLFFFVAYDYLSQALPQTTLGAVPSLLAREVAAPQLRQTLNAFPLPNGPDRVDAAGRPNGLADFTSNHSNTNTSSASSVRVDYSIRDGWVTFARVHYAPSTSEQRQGVSSWTTTSDRDALTTTAGLTATLSSNTMIDGRVNVSRSTYDARWAVDDWGGAGPVDDSYLFPSVAGNTLADFYLAIGGYLSRIAKGDLTVNTQHQFNAVASVTHVARSHVLKVGVDYRVLTPDFNGSSYQLQTSLRSLDDIRAGRVYVFRDTRRSLSPRFQNTSLFAQDSWTINQRATLTYGLRWDINPAPSEANDQLPPTLASAGSAAELRLAEPGTELYPTRYGDVAPRVGLAVQLSTRDGWSTTLNTGGGLFYDVGSQAAGDAFPGYPNRVSIFAGPFLLPLSSAVAAPPELPTTLTPPYTGHMYAYDPDRVTPRTWQWNVKVTQEIARDQSLSVAYVGALGRHLLRRQYYWGPNPDFLASLSVYRSDASSSYHGMSLEFARRLSRGLQSRAAYTWGHAIDDISDTLGYALAKASARFDVRQAGSVAVSYQLPTASHALRWLTNGLSLDGIARWRTALPVDVVATDDFIGDVELRAARPDLLAGVPFYADDPHAPGGRRFNPTRSGENDSCIGAVCTPPEGVEGNLGRNVFRGFGAFQIDIAVRRAIALRGLGRVILSLEAFNLLNHPNFGLPLADMREPDFGTPTSMLNRSLGGLDPLYQIGGPRSIQLGARFDF